MITKPTILILGAGASAPYGYPLGSALVDQVLDQLQPEQPLWRALMGHPEAVKMDGFRVSLRASDVASIDDFLESNPEYADLGKICIAAALTSLGPQRQYPVRAEHDWLRHVWHRMHQGAATARQFRDNRLRVVTYNFEDSVERYFARVLGSAYPDLRVARRDALERFRSEALPVVHVHGSLGGLDTVTWEANGEVLASFNEIGFYRSAAKGIRIVHEDELTVEYEQARQWIGEAEAVYFLGFGYHPTNVRRLDVRGQLEAAGRRDTTVVCGTALGFGDAQVQEALHVLGGPYHLFTAFDARTFLKERGPLL